MHAVYCKFTLHFDYKSWLIVTYSKIKRRLEWKILAVIWNWNDLTWLGAAKSTKTTYFHLTSVICLFVNLHDFRLSFCHLLLSVHNLSLSVSVFWVIKWSRYIYSFSLFIPVWPSCLVPIPILWVTQPQIVTFNPILYLNPTNTNHNGKLVTGAFNKVHNWCTTLSLLWRHLRAMKYNTVAVLVDSCAVFICLLALYCRLAPTVDNICEILIYSIPSYFDQ